jgi:RHS repeat-associated protein
VLERYVYDPYGQFTNANGQPNMVLTPAWAERAVSDYAWIYLHQDGRYDTMSGLYHFRTRDYSSTLGRWVQRDPIEFEADDLNVYRFVSGSPVTFVDPSGLEILDVDFEKAKFQLGLIDVEDFAFSFAVYSKCQGNDLVYTGLTPKGKSDPTVVELGLDTLALNELINQIGKIPVGKYVPALEITIKPKRILKIYYDEKDLDLRQFAPPTANSKGFSLTVKWELQVALGGKVQVMTTKPVLVTDELQKNPQLVNPGGFYILKNEQTIEGSVSVYQIRNQYRIGVNIAGKSDLSDVIADPKEGQKTNPFGEQGFFKQDKLKGGHVRTIWQSADSSPAKKP